MYFSFSSIVKIDKKRYNIYNFEMRDKVIKLLIFSVVMMSIIITILYLCHKYVTSNDTKNRILQVVSVITVIIHYSSLWVDFFLTGEAEVDNTMLLPIYPCNVCMWLLLIVSFMKNKESFMYRSLTEFLAIGGTICGLIGLFANEIFLANPSFSDYDSLKGLLSHSTMIFGTLFLLTEGYIKIRTLSLTLSIIVGLLIFVIDGVVINTLFLLLDLEAVNSMYLVEFPLDIPFVNSITLGLLGVILVFIITTIYETVHLDKEERWYFELKKHYLEKHNKE